MNYIYRVRRKQSSNRWLKSISIEIFNKLQQWTYFMTGYLYLLFSLLSKTSFMIYQYMFLRHLYDNSTVVIWRLKVLPAHIATYIYAWLFPVDVFPFVIRFLVFQTILFLKISSSIRQLFLWKFQRITYPIQSS